MTHHPKSEEMARKTGRPKGSSSNRGVEKVSKSAIAKAFSDGMMAGLERAKEISKNYRGPACVTSIDGLRIAQVIQAEIDKITNV